MKGACLCGAVTLDVGDIPSPDLSACHCDPCRKWAGVALWGFMVPQDQFRAEGPVASYKSSGFATRSWCRDCGTQLWFRDDGEDYEVNPGLFEETRDWPLDRVVYADREPRHGRLAGDHKRVSKAEYEARWKHVPDA